MSTPKTQLTPQTTTTNPVTPVVETPKATPQVTPAGKAIKLTNEQFMQLAKLLPIIIGGAGGAVAEPKQFSTGSVGWYAQGKIAIMVGDELVQCQLGMNLTVIGSKTAK